ncbi:MAG: complex I NDUFA9 subunit family protein [Alphaproteobacteria bacterium]|nr:complex I NDUFA9 subunit family protein [Alphaproteobacteria bacterium]
MANYPSTITIFGGTGFLGRYVVAQLAREGYSIRIPTRNIENAAHLRTMGDVGQIIPFLCSAHRDAQVATALKGANTAINLIGIMRESGHDTFQNIHVETAARIARIAKEEGVQNFLHLSVLGASEKSRSAYARSKMAGEKAVRTFFPNAVVFRPDLIFGSEEGYLNRLISPSWFSPITVLVGGGTEIISPIYAKDVASGIATALPKRSTQGKTYELTGPNAYSLKALLELVAMDKNRHPLFMNIPPYIAWATTPLLPRTSFIREQLELSKIDRASAGGTKSKTAQDLGINPTALEMVMLSGT